MTEEQQLRMMVEAVSKLPPPPPPKPLELEDINTIRCACGYMKDLSVARLYHTGVVQACEAVCAECRARFKPMSRLVCCSCRQIVGWLEPCTDKSGFKFEPGKSYHVEKCGFCDSTVAEATIIEKHIYMAYKSGDKRLITSLKTHKEHEQH